MTELNNKLACNNVEKIIAGSVVNEGLWPAPTFVYFDRDEACERPLFLYQPLATSKKLRTLGCDVQSIYICT